MRGLLLAAMLMISGESAAAEMRPFVSGSMMKIEAEHKNQPFILMLWSLTCAYCPAELKRLGELKQKNPALSVVLVATDTPEGSGEITQRLAGYGLGNAEQWVFADAMPERLRFEIDRHWYGEVPRSYFYSRSHQREVKMGLVEPAFIEGWIKRAAMQ